MTQFNWAAAAVNQPVESDAPPVDAAHPNPELDKAMCSFAKARLTEDDFKPYTGGR